MNVPDSHHFPSGSSVPHPDRPIAVESAKEAENHRSGGVIASTADKASQAFHTTFTAIWALSLLTVVVLALIFFFQNNFQQTVKFLGWTIYVPLSVALVCAFVLGALVVGLILGWRNVLLHRRIHKLK